ncbi:hypothetical protein OPQ81_007180 [Rhizoctonia solani]|nr:hypothetical protein OPQ81_007180 [Rhizoctonia solani]
MPIIVSRATSAARLVFQPPTGGDVVLKSCEGTIFHAHSVLLSLASTVFAGMFDAASRADVIELAEDTQTISLMLAFIYPVTPPPISTIDQLEKIMLFSQKYNIRKMIDYVEKDIRPESELIHSDPIRLFRASIKYDFPTIKSFAIQAFRPKHCDVLSASGLAKIAKYFPDASSVIGLIGAQVVRSSLMPKIKIGVTGSMRPRCDQAYGPGEGDHHPYMVCRKCWDRSYAPISAQYTPGWLWNWLNIVQLKLTTEPMHKYEDLFSIVCFTDL